MTRERGRAREQPERPRVRGGMSDETTIPAPSWSKREPIGRDPFHVARFGPWTLDVRVECACFWTWSIDSREEGELARGSTFVDVEIEEWDYQGVEIAKRRCVVVARALLVAVAAEIEGDPDDGMSSRDSEPDR